MSWPVCKGLAAGGYEVHYLALGRKRPPEYIDGVYVVPPILQDELEPEGVGGEQNLFIYLHKRIGPDAIVICLEDGRLFNILYQLKKAVGERLPVWIWILPDENGATGYGNAVASLPVQLKRSGIERIIRPGVVPPGTKRLEQSGSVEVLSIGRDMPRSDPRETLEMWESTAQPGHTLVWIADDASRAKTGIRAELAKHSLKFSVKILQAAVSGWASPLEHADTAAAFFFVESMKRLNTIGAVECILAGLAPYPAHSAIRGDWEHCLVSCSSAWNHRADSLPEIRDKARELYDPDTAVSCWMDVIKRSIPRPFTPKSRLKRIRGINFKGHIWGNGSMSLTTRSLALSMDRLGVPVSLETTTEKGADRCTTKPSERDTERLLELQHRKIDPAEYAHIRYSGPQSYEYHLHEGLVDITMGRFNIIYWSIDYSSLSGPGCPSPRLLNEMANQIWVLSRHNLGSLLECGVRPELLRIVPNGYDERIYHRKVRPRELGFQKFTFLSVANLKFFHRKGLDVLIDAYAGEFSEHEDVHLIIQSPTSANKRLLYECIEEASRKYNRRPAISVWDTPMTAEQLAPLYKACDCLVWPSRGESFGLPPLESLAVGTPVIVTRWGGMMDYCDHDTAYMVDYKLVPAHTWKMNGWGGGLWADPDGESLKYWMRFAFEHPEENRRKTENASAAMNQWTWEAAAKKALDYLAEIEL